MNGKGWVDRGWYLTLEFSTSGSSNFEKALELARSHPGFSAIVDNDYGGIVFRVIYRRESLEGFWTLWEMVKQWRSVKIYLKGDEVSPQDVEPGIKCYITSFDDELCYPKGIPKYIGCPQSRISIYPGLENPWYRIGRIEGKKFMTDKAAIKAAVSCQLEEVWSCPVVDIEEAMRQIKLLPDEIDLEGNEIWGVHRDPKRRRYLLHLLDPEAYIVMMKEVFGER